MKKSILILTLILGTTSAASATCFRFVNGKGPQLIGNYPLAATATEVCVDLVSRGSMSYTALTLSDAQGALAVAAVSAQTTGTCPAFCQSLSLAGGNINGANVDLTGTKVQIQTQVDSHLGIETGILEVKAGRDFGQKYLIMKVK